MFRSLAFFALLLSSLISQAQQGVIISKSFQMPKDSTSVERIVQSLNEFLAQKEAENKQNKFVIPADLPETSCLLDEMKGIEKSEKRKDDRFYKPYIEQAVKQSDNSWLVQLSYIGIEDKEPVIRATFELQAKPGGDRFYFSSPLKRNTANWNKKKLGVINLVWKDTLSAALSEAYLAKVTAFDLKLKSKKTATDFYYTPNVTDALKALGVLYKSDYTTATEVSLSARENSKLILVKGAPLKSAFDLHDCWHERFLNVVAEDRRNRPIDEGCAYLYGGSWGISWPQIYNTFKSRIASREGVNWVAMYENPENFGESQEKALYTNYVINALLVDKIEKEKGFPSVMEFLQCGPYLRTNENYFAALEKLTGINKENFNTKIALLVRSKEFEDKSSKFSVTSIIKKDATEKAEDKLTKDQKTAQKKAKEAEKKNSKTDKKKDKKSDKKSEKKSDKKAEKKSEEKKPKLSKEEKAEAKAAEKAAKEEKSDAKKAVKKEPKPEKSGAEVKAKDGMISKVRAAERKEKEAKEKAEKDRLKELDKAQDVAKKAERAKEKEAKDLEKGSKPKKSRKKKGEAAADSSNFIIK